MVPLNTKEMPRWSIAGAAAGLWFRAARSQVEWLRMKLLPAQIRYAPFGPTSAASGLVKTGEWIASHSAPRSAELGFQL